MLDTEIKNQIQAAFQKLTQTVILRVHSSSHSDQTILLEMLNAVASASDKIQVEILEQPKGDVPFFEIVPPSGNSRISFKGIPGGHEFTSLILGILNSDGKGKLPDDGMIERIRRLKGPIHLKTFVSLSCENCPEVVQALNLIASLHPQFHHEMVDGSYVQSEIESLGIQGVPSVVLDGSLIHSGKIAFLDLLKKLEERLGTLPSEQKKVDLGQFDVAVLGGGPAGVTAAIYSARKGLKTVIITDRIGGQVQETKGIENMISIPQTEGPILANNLGTHLKNYPIVVLEHRRVASLSGDKIKHVQLESGEFLNSSSVIIATGAKWRELGIPGEKEYIGQGVAFCAHCDGPFYKGKKVVVIGGGNSGVEAAIDLAGIASEVTLLEFGEKLKADEVLIQKLKSLPNTSIVLNAKSHQILGDGKKVMGLEYFDRKTNSLNTLSIDGVFVQIGLLPNSQFVKNLLDLTSAGEIIVDARGRTSISGIYAAGDVTTIPFKQIVTAMGDGAKVALTAFEDRIHA